MLKQLAIIAALALAAWPAKAWIHGGGGAGVCTAYTDPDGGCAGARADSTFQDTTFWISSRQSGQAAYYNSSAAQVSHPAPYYVACVDFKCGHYTPDASLLDPKVTTPANCTAYNLGTNTLNCATDKWAGTLEISGSVVQIDSTTSGSFASGQIIQLWCDPVVNAYCSARPVVGSQIDSTHWNITWGIGSPPSSVSVQAAYGTVPVSFDHYYINDIIVNVSGHGDTTFNDTHWTAGLNTCRIVGSGAWSLSQGNITGHYVTVDNAAICNPAANLYLTANDPGFSTFGTCTGCTIVNGVLTIGTFTGTLARGSVFNYAGLSGQQGIWTANSANSSLFSCLGSACNGTKWNVVNLPCPVVSGNGTICGSLAPDASINVASTAMTFGPLQETTYTAFGGASNGWGVTDIQYAVNLGPPALYVTTGAGSLFMRHNYGHIVGFFNVHANYLSQQSYIGQAVTIPDWHFDDSVIWGDKNSADGQGTSLITDFGTSNLSNSATGCVQVTQQNVSMSHNITVSNTSNNASGVVFGYNARVLAQGPGACQAHLVNLTIQGNGYDYTGANGYGNIAAGITVDNKVQNGNWDLKTGASADF